MKQKFDYDQLSVADTFVAADHAYTLIDLIQGMSPGEQIASVGFLFNNICAAHGAYQPRVLEMLDRITKRAKDSGYHKVHAAEDYIEAILK